MDNTKIQSIFKHWQYGFTMKCFLIVFGMLWVGHKCIIILIISFVLGLYFLFCKDNNISRALANMKAGYYNYNKISKLLSIYFFGIAASMAVCIIGIIVDSLFLKISSFFLLLALYIFVYIYEANDHLR